MSKDMRTALKLAARIGFNPYDSASVQSVAFARVLALGSRAQMVRPLSRAERVTIG
jgi:hypothetical protein